jgi:pyruvate dehydrogenase E1 component alpha subunit
MKTPGKSVMSWIRDIAVELPLHQWLDEDGVFRQPPPPSCAEPAQWLAAYAHLWLTRLFDRRAIDLQRTGRLGTYAGCLGQEAVSAAIGHAMSPDDVLVPYYRDQAAQLARGVRMLSILRFWCGDEWGAHDGPAQDLTWCIPIATQLTHAAGVAAALKLRHEHRAVVTTCGDGASSRGDFYEAMNLAGVWHLPLVIVINNNQWAISVPLHQQTAAATLAQKALACGIPGVRVDGNDFFAMTAVLDEALQRARTGKGPTLIEAVTYRLCDHTTADDMSRYADAQTREEAARHEPLLRFRKLLDRELDWSDARQADLEAGLTQRIDQDIRDYLALPPSRPEDMFDFLYAQLPADLARQKAAWLARRKPS